MKTIRLAIASLAAFLFNACGDDSPSVNINTGHASCTVYSESEDSYAIECPDGTKVTIRDGIDGVDGKDGEDGADGKDGKDGQNGANGKDGVDGEDGEDYPPIDSLIEKTSCTVQENDDETLAIICPDGTSALITKEAVASISRTTSVQKGIFTEYRFDLRNKFYIYDSFRAKNQGDFCQVKIYSDSDPEGVTLSAGKDPVNTSNYAVFFYVTPGKSHDSFVHAEPQDSIHIVYLSGHKFHTDSMSVFWAPKSLPNSASLSFDNSIYYGDSAFGTVVLYEPHRSEETIKVPLKVNEKNTELVFTGSKGYYTAPFYLKTSASANGTNVFQVDSVAKLVLNYKDSYTGTSIMDSVLWYEKVRASLSFYSEQVKFIITTSLTIRVTDFDDSSTIKYVWVKNESTGDSLRVELKKSSLYEYCSGSIDVTQRNDPGKLWIPDTTYVSASYYDKSVNETIVEKILVTPYDGSNPGTAKIAFRDSVYYGLTDKASFGITGNITDKSPYITLNVTSDSDPVGYTQDVIAYSSEPYNNTIGFTFGKSGNGFIHVSGPEKVYVSYSDDIGREMSATIKWRPDMAVDTWDYTCTQSDTALYKGLLDPANKYACQNGKFRKAKDKEILTGKACVDKNVGTVYSNEVSDYLCTADGFVNVFGSIKDTRDNKVYKTIRVGTQTWMAENLNFNDKASEDIDGQSMCYGNDPENCEAYGRLYRWSAAMNASADKLSGYIRPDTTVYVQGICPAGTHLPKSGDWEKLVSLASVMELRTYWSGTDKPANNITGMTILPSGSCSNNSCTYLDKEAYFWTVNEGSSNSASAYEFMTTNTSKTLLATKTWFYSVRCILD